MTVMTSVRTVRVTAGDACDELRNKRPSARRRDAESSDDRAEGRRDCDRILYSRAWRRLGGVTQVITPFEDLPSLHNRLTHSEKVAQVSRSIASKLLSTSANHELVAKLGGLDVDVCEAAALAHDLGHPPFGHVGEEALDQVARGILGLRDGFEGNAQTVRCVAIGKTRSLKYEGLDLSMATIAAIAKYPWTRALRYDNHDDQIAEDKTYRKAWSKFSFYDCHKDLLADSRQFASVGDGIQTIEASVMDIADDIAYAIHDLEDFYLGGILNIAAIREDLEDLEGGAPRGQADTPFVRLVSKLEADYPDWYSEDRIVEAARVITTMLRAGFSPRALNTSNAEAMARGEASKLIEAYIGGVRISETPVWPGGPHVMVRNEHWHQIQIMKEITRSYVISRPDIALLQRGQQAVIENLVVMLHGWAQKDRGRLPTLLLEEIQIAEKLAGGSSPGYGKSEHAPRGLPKRAILDYICGLTDAQCIGLYQKLSGAQVHHVAIAGSF